MGQSTQLRSCQAGQLNMDLHKDYVAKMGFQFASPGSTI